MPLFRGFAIETQPDRFQGFSLGTIDTHFQGVGVEIQVEPNPVASLPLQTQFQQLTCPGKVVDPNLIISGESNGYFLQSLNENYQESMHLSLEGVIGPPEVSWKLGGNDRPARVEIMDNQCRESICLEGQDGTLIVGCEYRNGQMILKNDRDEATLLLDGQTGQIVAGGSGEGGQLWILGENADPNLPDPMEGAFYMNGNNGTFTLNGTDLNGGLIHLRKQGTETMRVDYMQGVMEIRNADFAEEFEVAPDYNAHTLQPGMVVVLNASGAIAPCTQSHDKKVVGILSGAGPYRPGIVMDKQKTDTLRLPVALAGKVWCQVETREGPLREGDLLTTSDLKGYAQKAGGLQTALGSIIGKALQPLPQGQRAMIPVKVGLM